MAREMIECLESLRHTIRTQKIGKALPTDFYLSKVWVGMVCPEFLVLLPTEIQRFAQQSKRQIEQENWNIIKISKNKTIFSLLTYENPFLFGFPALLQSLIINYETETIKRQNYPNDETRFILHRKELLFPDNIPERTQWIELTEKCESAGLFEQHKKIGSKRFWNELLTSKGLHLDGQRLLNRKVTPK